MIASRNLNVLSTTFGNSLYVSCAFKDNYSSGTKLEDVNTEISDIQGYWQSDSGYADDSGRIYMFDFAFGHFDFELSSYDIQDPFDIDSLKLRALALNAFRNLPETPILVEDLYKKMIYTTDKIILRKDSRERIILDYQLEAQTTESDIIIGSYFMKAFNAYPALEAVMYIFKEPVDINKFDTDIDISTIDCKKRTISETDFSYKLVQYKESGETRCERIGLFTPTNSNPPRNLGYGWVLATPPKTEEIEVKDEDGNIIKQTINTGGKILLLSNSSDTDEIKLYFSLQVPKK